jgi:hypothetical protein
MIDTILTDISELLKYVENSPIDSETAITVLFSRS